MHGSDGMDPHVDICALNMAKYAATMHFWMLCNDFSVYVHTDLTEITNHNVGYFVIRLFLLV